MAAKLTPWFPGRVLPVRKGIYEREWPDLFGSFFARWDGFRWSLSMKSPAAVGAGDFSAYAKDDLRWRGLAASSTADQG